MTYYNANKYISFAMADVETTFFVLSALLLHLHFSAHNVFGMRGFHP